MSVNRAQGMLSQAGAADGVYGPLPGVVDLNKGLTIEPGMATPPNMDGASGVRSLLRGGPHPTVVFLIVATVVLALLMNHRIYGRASFGVGG